MKTTIDHLLTPRFEVIADYPNSQFKVGEILDRDWAEYPYGDESTESPNWKVSNYPNLFRPLNWWEKRTEEEMPKYLKQVSDSGIMLYFMIGNWDMGNLTGIWDSNKTKGCSIKSYLPEYTFQPCSESEYLENLQL